MYFMLAGGIVRAGSSSAPSVVGILPQPDAAYSRYGCSSIFNTLAISKKDWAQQKWLWYACTVAVVNCPPKVLALVTTGPLKGPTS